MTSLCSEPEELRIWKLESSFPNFPSPGLSPRVSELSFYGAGWAFQAMGLTVRCACRHSSLLNPAYSTFLCKSYF